MQKLQLSIPEPCHENWQQMTPTEQGRFCNACAKEVIDFSTMTDIQVLNYFSALTHEKVCGRALPEQLNRPISRPDIPKKRVFWYWNYIVMFFMLFGKSNAAKAQGSIKAITEVRPSKHNDINNALAGRVGRVSTQTGSLVITGKVTDIEGNPVSFASVKIKGTNTGVSADANGTFSIRINSKDVLQVSAVSFKTIEVPVVTQSVINAVLEASGVKDLGIVVTTMNCFGDGYYGPLDMTKHVAVLKVQDEETGKPLPNVFVVININSNAETAFTDKKGVYKHKVLKEYEKCFIRLSADGYEPAEFTIDVSDFKDKKKEWAVLLRKQKVETVRSSATPKPATETSIRMGGMSSINVDIKPLYIVDGVIVPGGADINPDDIEDISVLQGPAAAALYGQDGAYGAIVITMRKQVVNLDTVVVTTYRNTVLGGMVQGVQVKRTVADTLKMFVNKMTGAIKVYPNPVLRGEEFSIALKPKQTGLHQIQITDAMGRIVLQKQFNAGSKDLTERILADKRWSSGIYYISITDNKNQLVNKSSFIVRW